MKLSLPQRNWRPARFSGDDTIFLVWLLVAVAVIRAVDYTYGGETTDPERTVTEIEHLIPLQGWSALLAVGALSLAGGVLAHQHRAVWVGHAILCGSYFLIGAGVTVAMLGAPFFDGIRAAGPLLIVAILHYMLAARTGPKPLERDDAVPTETIEGDAA